MVAIKKNCYSVFCFSKHYRFRTYFSVGNAGSWHSQKIEEYLLGEYYSLLTRLLRSMINFPIIFADIVLCPISTLLQREIFVRVSIIQLNYCVLCISTLHVFFYIRQECTLVMYFN